MSNFQRQLLVFGRFLRSLGLDIHVGRMLDATEALLHVDIGRRNDVYHTLPGAARSSSRRPRDSSTGRSMRFGRRTATGQRDGRAARRGRQARHDGR